MRALFCCRRFSLQRPRLGEDVCMCVYRKLALPLTCCYGWWGDDDTIPRYYCCYCCCHGRLRFLLFKAFLGVFWFACMHGPSDEMDGVLFLDNMDYMMFGYCYWSFL
jgi:hypothetical protein